jgi:tryptophan-rich sensory protein
LALVGFVGLSLLVCAADAVLASSTMRGWYLSLVRPPGTAPNWLFGAGWALLYVLIGVAAWLVWHRSVSTRPLRLWGWQLALNAFWIPAFFAFRSPLLGLAVLLALVPMVAITIRSFRRVHPAAGWLMVPYLISIGYAIYLDAGFCWLNPV